MRNVLGSSVWNLLTITTGTSPSSLILMLSRYFHTHTHPLDWSLSSVNLTPLFLLSSQAYRYLREEVKTFQEKPIMVRGFLVFFFPSLSACGFKDAVGLDRGQLLDTHSCRKLVSDSM